MKLLGFNQDASCFSVVSPNKGMTIYNCDPFGKCFELEKPISGGAEQDFLVEMLFSTSLIAVVDKSIDGPKKKKLKIVNTKRKATICELTFPHEIINVIMNRKIICVVLQSDQIFVYDISCMKLLRTVDVLEEKLKIVNNNKQVKTLEHSPIKISLSTDNNSILCYTSYSKTNKDSFTLSNVVIFDAINCIELNSLPDVHQSNIACIACSSDGTLVATASEKGTIIRVFQTGINQVAKDKVLINEYRRGSRPTRIYEMKFNQDNSLLACVGESDTIHIFALPSTSIEAGPDDDLVRSTGSVSSNNGFQQMSKGIATHFGKIMISKLPTQREQRHIAYIKVRENAKYRIGFPKDVSNVIHICGDDGNFLVYSIPVNEQGPCVLMKSSTFI